MELLEEENLAGPASCCGGRSVGASECVGCCGRISLCGSISYIESVFDVIFCNAEDVSQH